MMCSCQTYESDTNTCMTLVGHDEVSNLKNIFWISDNFNTILKEEIH